MLNDVSRNNVYECSIKSAIVCCKELKLWNEVLDVGVGNGLFFMFVMCVGVDFVYVVEMSFYMCDAGEETVCMNGYGIFIMYFNCDV